MLNQQITEQQICTADKLASILGVSRVTLWKWERDGKLIPKRIGKRVFYNLNDVIFNQAK